MLKYLINFLLILFLTGCSVHNDTTSNITSCKDIEIVNVSKSGVNTVDEICNYEKKALIYIESGGMKKISFIYHISKLNQEFDGGSSFINILKKVKKSNLSYIEKLQIYYILKHEYNFSENTSEELIGAINIEHKSFVLPLGHIILGENLLTTDYRDVQNEEIEGGNQKGEIEYLGYEHIKYLDILFTHEPERIKHISLIMSLDGVYFTLNDDKSRSLFIKILERLQVDIGNITQTEIYIQTKIQNSLEKYRAQD